MKQSKMYTISEIIIIIRMIIKPEEDNIKNNNLKRVDLTVWSTGRNGFLSLFVHV